MGLDMVGQILGGLGCALKETDQKIANNQMAALEEIMAADFMPGLQGLVRALAHVGDELAKKREQAINAISIASEGRVSVACPSNLLAEVLKIRGICNALVSALGVVIDAAEMEAISLDRATSALCVGAAFVDRYGRVIVQK